MYVEESVLLAVMEEDYDKARNLLSDFFAGELRDLEEYLSTISGLIADELEKRADH